MTTPRPEVAALIPALHVAGLYWFGVNGAANPPGKTEATAILAALEANGWTLASAASLDVTCPVCGSRFDPANFTHHAALAPAASESLRAALEWAMKRLDPYTHEPECSPTRCACGFDKARAALATTPPDPETPFPDCGPYSPCPKHDS